jgi:hypothetical protein
VACCSSVNDEAPRYVFSATSSCFIFIGPNVWYFNLKHSQSKFFSQNLNRDRKIVQLWKMRTVLPHPEMRPWS